MKKNFSYKEIFTMIFFIIISSFIVYISWIKELFSFFLSIFFYSWISYFFYFLWKKFRKKEYLNYKKFLALFLYKVSIWILVIIVLIWSFSFYENKINPTKMPSFTISNWKKTVIFQAMSHIWTKDFYNKVKNNLIQAKKNWYVYFYEWVKWWSKKNMSDFNKAIWIKFDKNLYKNFSKLYWVTNQDNSIFFNLVNNLDFNVDLNIDEIMEAYNKLPKTKNNNFLKDKKVIDANKEIIKTLSQLNPKELEILRYINKAILNFIISNDSLKNQLLENFANKNLFKIILDKRNKNLAKNIINSKYDKIFITYWLLHFDWVLKLLQSNDKNWKIINTNYLYPIQ